MDRSNKGSQKRTVPEELGKGGRVPVRILRWDRKGTGWEQDGNRIMLCGRPAQ